MRLSEVLTGKSVYLVCINGSEAFRKRMHEMGFIKGRKITVIKNAPLKDPIEFSLMGYNVTLRRSEAFMIGVTTRSNERTLNGKLFLESLRHVQDVSDHHKEINIAIVGNPNSGKTTIFNRISRSRERVGNYPGVTLGSKTSSITFRNQILQMTDLPGIYSFSIYSPEELYTRDFILDEKPDIVINIIDASNLERNLYLTTQLIDMNVKVVVALNMYDELVNSQDEFDYRTLGSMLGIPFVPTIGSKSKGLRRLLLTAIDFHISPEKYERNVRINYGDEIELSISRITEMLEKDYCCEVSPRFLAIGLLEGDHNLQRYFAGHPEYGKIITLAQKEAERISQVYGETVESVMSDARYGFIYGALKETYKPGLKDKRETTSKIDNLLTDKRWGFPFFLLFLWVMFTCTFVVGNYPKDWIEQGVGLLSHALDGLMAEGSFKSLLIDGIVKGVGSVIVFLPNILILFFFISIMEDTGYMARAVFLMDKLMHKIGLHGKSFIPLIMGFGCNVPAIMATRTIENRNNRLVTILINPFMSCSARLPVYILLIGAIFPAYKGSILFLIYLSGVITAIIIALIFKKTFFRGEEAPFVMELPPYRFPTILSTLRHMWYKGSQYLKKMGGIIVIASILIWALGHYPVQHMSAGLNEQERENVAARYDAGTIQVRTNPASTASLIADGNSEKGRTGQTTMAEQQEKSYIGQIGKFIEPAIEPLGFDWRMGVCLLSGIAAKEIIVSTMGIIYQPETGFSETGSLQERIREMRYTEGEKQGERVFTPLVTISFVAFVLLYFPCIATITAIGKESGSWRWAVFTMLYTTGLAWLVSFMIYQAGLLTA
ncbi:MAG: ferrous iron transport protein B [Bacteroidales bacterium]|nr:ferrous iron transport protein B [Bacteroidales bacterium]